MPHVDIIINGKKCPSVTDIVGCVGKEWKEHWHRRVGFTEADRISRESREQGSRCHALVEAYLKGHQVQPANEKDKRLFGFWLTWWSGANYKVVSQEQLVISKKKMYGGTYDCVVTDGEKLIIADWKFSKNEDRLRPIQLGGYSYAFNESNSDKINYGLIVRIDWKEEKLIQPKLIALRPYEKKFLILRKAYDIGRGK